MKNNNSYVQIVYISHLNYKKMKEVDKVKIPKKWMMKNPWKFPEIVKNPIPIFKNILDENDGLVQISLLYRYAFMTDRPELIRHFLQKNHKNYIKTKIVREKLKEKIGNGLLTSDGDYWLKQRRAIQPGFHRKRLEAISKIMIQEINYYLDNYMERFAETGEVFDMSKEMTHLAYRIVSKSLFSGSISEDELSLIDQTITETQKLVINEIRQPFVKPWLWLKGDLKKNKELRDASDKTIFEAIEERRKSNEKHDDLLDMLLETRYEDGSGMTDQQLRDEALILYVAGHETSANALTWAWYLLATHPEVEQKLLHHAQDVLGGDSPSFEKIRELGYTLQVVEETMRMYPPAWITDREPLEDDEFEGIEIKKGQDIIAFIYGVHHNKKYWENPEVFDPERFSPENKKKQVPFSYMPFGGGPRLCIGNNFALMEMQFVLTEMIRRYKIEIIKDQKIELNPLITLRPRYGLKCRVKRRV